MLFPKSWTFLRHGFKFVFRAACVRPRPEPPPVAHSPPRPPIAGAGGPPLALAHAQAADRQSRPPRRCAVQADPGPDRPGGVPAPFRELSSLRLPLPSLEKLPRPGVASREARSNRRGASPAAVLAMLQPASSAVDFNLPPPPCRTNPFPNLKRGTFPGSNENYSQFFFIRLLIAIMRKTFHIFLLARGVQRFQFFLSQPPPIGACLLPLILADLSGGSFPWGGGVNH